MNANGMREPHARRIGQAVWTLVCGLVLLAANGCGGTPAEPKQPPGDPPKKTVSVEPGETPAKKETPPEDPPKKGEPTPGEPTPAEPRPGDPPPKVDLPKQPEKTNPEKTKAEPKKIPEPPPPPPPVKLAKLDNWKKVQEFDYGQRVAQASFSPEGDLLAAAGSGDKAQPPLIRLWKTSDWSSAGNLAGHTDTVAAFVFSPAKPQLISLGGSISRDSELKVWDLKTKTSLALTGHGGVVGALAIDVTGGLLATAGDSRVIRLWDVAGKLTPATRPFEVLRGHDDAITNLAFSPDVKFLASTSADFTVRLWVVAERRQRTALKGHTQTLTACAFSPDGEKFVSVDAGGEARIWDVFTLNELGVIRLSNNEVATAVSISPDGKTAVVGLATGEVAVIDLDERKAVGAIPAHKGYVNSVAFAPDGRLVTGGEDGQVLVWEQAK